MKEVIRIQQETKKFRPRVEGRHFSLITIIKSTVLNTCSLCSLLHSEHVLLVQVNYFG